MLNFCILDTVTKLCVCIIAKIATVHSSITNLNSHNIPKLSLCSYKLLLTCMYSHTNLTYKIEKYKIQYNYNLITSNFAKLASKCHLHVAVGV